MSDDFRTGSSLKPSDDNPVRQSDRRMLIPFINSTFNLLSMTLRHLISKGVIFSLIEVFYGLETGKICREYFVFRKCLNL